jgi:hypothetical protein
MDVVYVAAFGALIVALIVAAKRSRELFLVTVTGGRVTVRRGRVPPRFLVSIRELSHALRDATICGVKDGEGGRLVLSGSVDEATAQRLRNAWALARRTTAL